MKRHIVWIHGWGLSAQIWGDTTSFLPGYEHHFATYEGCRNRADFQVVLLQKLQGLKGSLTVIGWSMGGMLALELMFKAEADVNGYEVAAGLVWDAIVIVSGTLQFVHKQRSLGWPVRVVERMRSQLQTQPEETLKQFKQSMFSELDRAKIDWNPALEQELLVQKTDFSNQALGEGLTYLIETDLTSQWNNAFQYASQDIIGPPRFFWMHGEDDPICPIGAMPDLPEKNRHIYPGTGHVPFLTDRVRFYEHLRSFLHANQ